MAQQPLHQLIRSLAKFGAPMGGALSDAQLLERFVANRDEAAFELLVWRHGPMVLGTCRRILAEPQDAEDAFQTTFLALVRKARAVSNGQALSGWLYQVAYRAALRLRAARAKRAGREQPGVDQLAAVSIDAASAHELRQVLDEEINRLPAHQRTAFVLCCMEGKTGEEAARLLGCPAGTVSSRLTRARNQLRGRLLRRGLAPAAALIAGLGREALASTPPHALVGAAVKAVSGPPSAEILSHVEGVLRAMLLSKLKNATFLLAALSVLVAGSMFARHALQAQPPEAEGPLVPPAQVAADKADKKDPKGPVAVTVVKPGPGPLARTIQQGGEVHSFAQANIFAAVPGVLKTLSVDIGDRVKKGQVLAVIDAPLLELDLKLAKAAFEQAQGQLRQAAAAVATANAEEQSARGIVLQRKAELNSAEAAATFRKAQRDRMGDLFKSKSIEQRLLDEQESQLLAAKALVATAHAALANAKTDVDVQQSKIAQAQAAVATVSAKVGTAEAALERAQYMCALQAIIAPFDAVVTRRNYSAGDYLRPGEQGGLLPLLTIQRMDVLRVVVEVNDRDVAATEVGDLVTLTFGGPRGVKFPSKIARIGFVVDPKLHTMRVEVDLPNPEQRLRPGMFCTSKIQLKGTRNALRVPAESLVYGYDDVSVYVVRDGKAILTPIGTGYSNGTETEVLSGLRPEDLVVTNPGGLKGDSVPVEAKPGAAPK